MTGMIFDIQRFSIHDGPGIRTTVFLKGCSLHCVWCHNPESQKLSPELAFYRHKCLSCGKCADFCKNAFTEKCASCGKCVTVCPAGARELIGRKVSAEEVFYEVVRDKEFYVTSGGGMTLSGGEPLLQPDFCAEISSLCKKENIHVAIETAGNVPWENIEKVLPFCDIFLYDIKAIDEENHRRCTGADNKLIISNAEKLRSLGKNILFRTPVVPGYNDGQLQKISAFCGKNHEILAYHDIGKGKYEALGKKYSVDALPPSAEYMTALAEKYGAVYRPTGV